jgi:hypothetical protein
MLYAGWLPSITDTIWGVLITLGVTILWTHIRDALKSRKDRQRLAAVLLAEVLNQAAFIIHLGSSVNFVLGQKMWTQRADLLRMMPSKPLVFEAMVQRLPILDAKLCGNIVTFYECVERVRSFVDHLPEEMATEEAAQVRFGEISFATSMAAEVGQSIIRDLITISTPPFGGNVAVILTGLAALRAGGSPSTDPILHKAA